MHNDVTEIVDLNFRGKLKLGLKGSKRDQARRVVLLTKVVSRMSNDYSSG